MTLYISDSFKAVGGLLIFDAENENGKLYNVAFTPEDFEAYLHLEDGAINIDSLCPNTDWDNHAQNIYDAWSKGHTDYEVQVTEQKIVAYNFTNEVTCKSSRVFANAIGNLAQFMKKNNFTTYSPIYQ